MTLAVLACLGTIGPLTPAAWLTLFTPAAAAQDQALPAAEEIIEQSIAASGGREAIAGIQSRVTQGTFEMPAMGLTATMTTYAAAPNKVYSVAESPAIGKIEQGSDGKVHWESNMMTGPRIKEGEERAAAERDARFHGDLEWRELYKEVATEGIVGVEGRTCYKVVMTPMVGKPEYHYFDVETHLLQKLESTVTSEMGDMTVEVYPSDYRPVDGVMIAFKSRQVLMGMQEMIITTTSVEHNADLGDDVFALPDAVAALLDGQE